MTKVDERAEVPPVAEAARERLAKALDVEGLAAAYLFGSRATGKAGPLSDVDVAVWSDPAFDRGSGLTWQLRLMQLASRAPQTDEVQAVILNDAPPLMQHRAVRDGVGILERDRSPECAWRPLPCCATWTQSPCAKCKQPRRARMAEGRFGRR